MFKALMISAIAIFLFAVSASEISAQNWKNLGTKEVTDQEESDTFHIGSTKGQFRR